MNHDLRLGLFLSHFPVFGPVMPWPGERSGLTPDVHFRLHRAEQFRTSSLVRAGNYIPSCSFIKKQSNNYRAPTLPCSHAPTVSLIFMIACKAGGIIPPLMDGEAEAG